MTHPSNKKKAFPWIFLLTFMIANFLLVFTMLRSSSSVEMLFQALAEETGYLPMNFYIGLSLIFQITATMSIVFDYHIKRWMIQKFARTKDVYRHDLASATLLSYSLSSITGLFIIGLPFAGLDAQIVVQGIVQIISFVVLFKDDQTGQKKDPKVVKITTLVAVIYPLTSYILIYLPELIFYLQDRNFWWQ